MGKYDHLERDALVSLLERRHAERQSGLVREREVMDNVLMLRRRGERLDSDGPFLLERLRWT